MPRVKGGIITHKKHKKIKKLTKGFIYSRRASIRRGKEALLKAQSQAFAGRKKKKREFRRLWIIRINAKAKEEGLSYSKLINLLKKKNIKLDRKILAKLAFEYPKIFSKICEEAKK